jgi:MFS family permease
MTLKNPQHYFMKSLIVINVLIITAGAFFTPLWAVYSHHIGGDLRTAGNAIGLFSVSIGVFTCIAGKIENYCDWDEYFVVGSQLMFVLGYFCFFFIVHPWQLYFVQIWLGLAGSIQVPALFSLYQRYMPLNKATFAWGLWNGFYNIAVGIGAFASAYVAHIFGFRGVFILLNAVAIAGLFVAGYVVYQMRRHKPVAV